MAQNSNPNRNVWLAGGVTLAVILVGTAIISGPSIVGCLGSDAGFGTCLRGKMVDAGLVPQPAANASGETDTETAEAPATATSAEATPKTEAGAAEAGAAATAALAPKLGLVRAEPDGSLVIAGSAQPGATVEIYANDTLLGTATTEPSGDWVLVPDAPLAPGGYEIRVIDPKEKKASEQSVVVAINEDKKSEPLVVASEPGKASQVLQGLTETQQTAMAEPQAAAGDQTAAEPTAGATSEAAGQTETAAPTETAAAVQTETEAPQAAQQESQAGGSSEQQATSAGAAPAEVATAETTPETAPTPSAAAEDVVGDVAGLQDRIDALAANPPTIDAIEIDGGKNFFAGTGANGATVRVYVDNKFVGDATVANGHWLLETEKVLAEKSQRVRVDQLVTGSADVASRAEVEFIFKAPKGEAPAEAPTAVADAGNISVPVPDFSLDSSPPAPATSEPAQPTAEASSETAAQAAGAASVAVPQPDFGINTEEPAPVAVAAAPAQSPSAATPTNGSGNSGAPQTAAAQPSENPTIPTPDFAIDTGVPVVVGGEGTPGTATMTAQTGNGTSAGTGAVEAQPEAGQPAAEATAVAQTPAAPILVPVPDFSINTEAPAPVPAEAASAGAQPEASTEVPTMVAEPVGSPEDQRFVSGKAIIRRGDNLWTIARRVYGEGLRYTTIYQANKDQIRDPNLIYPGQVFELPVTDN